MDKSRWLILAWSIIVMVNIMQLMIVEFTDPEKFDINQLITFPIVTFFVGLLAIFALILPAYTWLSEKGLYTRVAGLTATGLLYGAFYVPLIFAILALWLGESFNSWFIPVIKGYFATDYHNVIKNYIFLLAILFAHDYMSSRALSLSQQKKLEHELSRVRLEALKSRLQPHFLFNALHSVVAIIEEDKDKAQQMLINLSSLLRRSLNSDFSAMIPLQEELNVLRKYLSIEKARFESQLDAHFDIPRHLMNTPTPPFILQPIVENAIKHGYRNHPYKLTLEVIAEEGQDGIFLKVRNNGARLPSQLQEGNGLRSVRNRLEAHFGQPADCRLYEEKEWVAYKMKVYEKNNNPGC